MELVEINLSFIIIAKRYPLEQNMLSDIFINLTILVSFLFLFGQIFRGKDFEIRQPQKDQLRIGLIFGVLGILLMVYTINSTGSIIIDLRNIAIISSGIVGGPFAALLSALLIAIFRIAYFGVSQASLIAFWVSVVLGFTCMFISFRDLPRRNKFIYMFFFAIGISSIALTYLIVDKVKLLETLSFYWLVHIIGALLSYYALKYILNTNLTYRQMFYNTVMADNLLDMLSTHKLDFSFSNVSLSSMHLLGYSPDELMGMSPLALIHPEDLERTRQSIDNHLRHPKYSTTITYRIRRKDGKYIWVESTAKNLHDGDGVLTEIVCATRDITERKNFEEELLEAKIRAEKMASTDHLTGIMNRRAFLAHFEAECKRAEREKIEISLILADIDRFKNINDTYGHNNGDVVLTKFTDCLAGICRPYDFIGRLGGEEFMICLTNTTCEQAGMIAERLRSAVEQLSIRLDNEDMPIHLTASFGVVSNPIDEKADIQVLIMKADQAMYQAKANGRNQVYTSCSPG